MPESNFFWDPVEDNIIQERDETGAITAEYATEPYLYGNLISQNRGGVESQYHFDSQGSTLALSDDNQQVTDTYAYTALGEVTEHMGDTINPFQYIGQKGYYGDSVTAGYRIRRRELAHISGQWLSVDSDEVERQLRPYIYCHNSPVRFVDPSGLLSFECEVFTGKFYGAPLATLMCKDLVLVVVFDESARPLDPCIRRCIYEHESVHIEQFDEACTGFCECDGREGKFVSYPPSLASQIECPAYRAERSCLERYLAHGQVGCSRADIIQEIMNIDKIVKDPRMPFKCNFWRLPIDPDSYEWNSVRLPPTAPPVEIPVMPTPNNPTPKPITIPAPSGT